MKIHLTYISGILIATSILCAVAGGVYIYALRYIESENAQVLALRQALEEGKQKVASSESLTRNVESTQKLRDELVGHLVSQSEIVDFIKLIESLGPKSGGKVSIGSISLDDAAAKNPGSISNGRLRVSVSGSWTQVTRALLLVENLPYRVAMNTLSLERVVLDDASAKKGVSSWKADFDITIRTLQ